MNQENTENLALSNILGNYVRLPMKSKMKYSLPNLSNILIPRKNLIQSKIFLFSGSNKQLELMNLDLNVLTLAFVIKYL